MPNLSTVSGTLFSMKTSAVSTSLPSISLPSGLSRSSVTLFLLLRVAVNWVYLFQGRGPGSQLGKTIPGALEALAWSTSSCDTLAYAPRVPGRMVWMFSSRITSAPQSPRNCVE